MKIETTLYYNEKFFFPFLKAMTLKFILQTSVCLFHAICFINKVIKVNLINEFIMVKTMSIYKNLKYMYIERDLK